MARRGLLSGAPAALSAPGSGLTAPGPQAYDERRGSSSKRGYDYRWQKASTAFKNANPFCLGCRARGEWRPATVADHIVPVALAPSRRFDPDNWQAACDWCHSVLKQRLEAMFAAGDIDEADLRLDSETALRLARTLQTPG